MRSSIPKISFKGLLKIEKLSQAFYKRKIVTKLLIDQRAFKDFLSTEGISKKKKKIPFENYSWTQNFQRSVIYEWNWRDL